MLHKLKSLVDGSRIENKRDRVESIHLESETNGFLPFNTASIRIKPFYDNSKSERIGNVSYHWFREYEGRSYAIDNIEDFHNVSCEDIGSKILVTVSDNDRPEVKSSLSFGPIILDPQVKIELESSLNSGKAKFEVQYPYKHLGNDALIKPNMSKTPDQIIIDELSISETTVTMIHSKGKSVSIPLASVKIDQVENYPLVVKISMEETHANFDFFEVKTKKSVAFFYIKFFNRVFREHFLLLQKLFKEIKLIPYQTAIDEIKKKGNHKTLFATKFANVLSGNSTIGDLLIQTASLRETLQKNISYTKSVIEDKEALTDYCQSLENDLHATLKELKGIVEKKNLHDQVDVSRIKKVETSMLAIEKERKENDNSFRGNPPEGFRSARFEKIKEDNEKLQKLNKLLLKELNAYREKKKEKVKMINQSLNNLQKEVQDQANNIDTVMNQSMDVSRYLDNFQNDMGKSMLKKSKPSVIEELKMRDEKILGDNLIDSFHIQEDEKKESIDSKRLQVENENLKKEVDELKKNLNDLKNEKQSRVEILDEKSLTKTNSLLIAQISQFRAFLDRVSENKHDQIESEQTFESLNFSVFEKKSNATKLNILNAENAFLNSVLTATFDILDESEVNKSDLRSDNLREIHKLLNNFRSTVEKMNKELLDLQTLAESLHQEGPSDGNPIIKQNNVMKSEIEKLKTENELIKSKSLNFENVENDNVKRIEALLVEKERIIQQLTGSNANLAAEIQNLQEIVSNN